MVDCGFRISECVDYQCFLKSETQKSFELGTTEFKGIKDTNA
jgi:hypothetical protein